MSKNNTKLLLPHEKALRQLESMADVEYEPSKIEYEPSKEVYRVLDKLYERKDGMLVYVADINEEPISDSED